MRKRERTTFHSDRFNAFVFERREWIHCENAAVDARRDNTNHQQDG